MTTAKALIGDDTDFIVSVTLIVADVNRSTAFYRDVFEATVLREGEPTFLRLGNIWLTINVGGGGTDDKPDVTAAPPRDPQLLSAFLNLRVRDIGQAYEAWHSRGAHFITEPKTHPYEKRCYIRDPDGYLIEVGQTTFTATPFVGLRVTDSTRVALAPVALLLFSGTPCP